MGVFSRKSANTPHSTDRDSPPLKTEYDGRSYPADNGFHPQEIHGIEFSEETKLTRGLKARHITMIAIGGAIGTGLIIGTGVALARAGPASMLISYSLVGFLVWIVMSALGEMAAWLPLSSGFTGYAARFCDPALGFALGWTYVKKTSSPTSLGRKLTLADIGSNISSSPRTSSLLAPWCSNSGCPEIESILVFSSQFSGSPLFPSTTLASNSSVNLNSGSPPSRSSSSWESSSYLSSSLSAVVLTETVKDFDTGRSRAPSNHIS
jgi:Amino acid permease